MKLHLVLPRVEPDKVATPTRCPYQGCDGKRLRWHQEVAKAIRDTKYEQVQAQRYQCLKCQRTFRVYPQGVSRAQTSLRGKGLAVMLYLLGLSYGATSLALEALGVSYCKSQGYYAVQEAASRVLGLKRDQVFEGLRTAAMGADLTSVKCCGKWLSLGLTVDSISGLVLTLDELSGQDIDTLKDWIEPIAKSVGACVLVTDDADGFKTVADEVGVQHQLCKAHVLRNTESLIEQYQPLVAQDTDGSLKELGISPAQAQADLKRLGELIKSRKREQASEVESMHRRYIRAAPPQQGKHQSLAYRLRLFFLDRWNLWNRLTRYRTWKGPNKETLDGTNNACERAIGWWIKERYRTMRGYKVPATALKVSRLLVHCGNSLKRGGADLALLLK
ncbi:MAG: IS66 family transposase [Chloroflexota bacterium]|nr:IS66 family transposase [Chloroflexota bacterium]